MLQDLPDSPDSQLRWLVDRECIRELLSEYSRAIDCKEYAAIAACFIPTGYVEFVDHPLGRIAVRDLEADARAVLGCYAMTHHINVPHSIGIDADSAVVRQSVFATHVPESHNINEHGDVGGWYEMSLERTPAGWRFACVRTIFLWTSGRGYPGSPEYEALRDRKRRE